MKTINRSSPTRRSRADISAIKELMLDIARELKPMTVRQMFYQLVSRGAIEKTEQEYKGTVCRLLGDLRRSGEMPFSWIADSTRWMRKPNTHDSLASMLEESQQFYRRAIWADQDAYVEIWLEKEALAGVLFEETQKWDVPLMVTRGYPSLSYVHETAEQINGIAKPVYLYYFGDHDPSGVDIPRFVERSIREYAPDAEIHFERLAVLPTQIDKYQLQTRPTKKTDSRSKGFEGESVEVDAIDPGTLRRICGMAITKHIDRDVLQRTRNAEEAERETLGMFAATLGETE